MVSVVCLKADPALLVFLSVREMKLWWKHIGTLNIHPCSATFQRPWAEYGRLSLRVHGIGVRFLVSFPSPTSLLSSALAFELTALLNLCIDHELLKALKSFKCLYSLCSLKRLRLHIRFHCVKVPLRGG